jgi:predicted RNase H-like HicB family nuclease
VTTVQIEPIRFGYTTVVREDYATDGSRTVVAEIPELVGCMSHGDTPEEALRNLEEAAALYLEALGGNAPAPAAATTNVQMTSGTGLEGLGGAVSAAIPVEVETELKIERVA